MTLSVNHFQTFLPRQFKFNFHQLSQGSAKSYAFSTYLLSVQIMENDKCQSKMTALQLEIVCDKYIGSTILWNRLFGFRVKDRKWIFIFICLSFMIMHENSSHPLDHLPIINDTLLCRHYKFSFCQSFQTMEAYDISKENTLMYLGEYFSSAFLGWAKIFQPPLFLSRDRLSSFYSTDV